MKPLTKRRVLDTSIWLVVGSWTMAEGGPLLAVASIAFGLWNYYDGFTRKDLKP